MDYAHPEALVSTEWLARHLDDDGVAIVDASFKLPGITPTAAEDYAKAHIPGAVFFDIDAVADRANPLPHMLPAPQEFARMVGKLGIGDGRKIVVYDTAGTAATRVWWMLRIMGHGDVAVLDGGLRKWRAEGRPVTDAVPHPTERRFTPHFDAGARARPGADAGQPQKRARAGGGRARRRALCGIRARAAAGAARRPHPGRRQSAVGAAVRSQDRHDAAGRRACRAAEAGRALARREP